MRVNPKPIAVEKFFLGGGKVCGMPLFTAAVPRPWCGPLARAGARDLQGLTEVALGRRFERRRPPASGNMIAVFLPYTPANWTDCP